MTLCRVRVTIVAVETTVSFVFFFPRPINDTIIGGKYIERNMCFDFLYEILCVAFFILRRITP